MPRLAFAGLHIEWDPGDLPVDPFLAALPLALDDEPLSASHARADVLLWATSIDAPAPRPVAPEAPPVLFHGNTLCVRQGEDLVLWDGASLLRVAESGARIEAQVHPSSLERAFHFSSVTVTMALLLALRSRGLFHLHAAAARFDGGETWLLPGESDAGKSTLALALFSTGAHYLSDDAVLLREDGRGAVEVVGLPRMIHMSSLTAAAFPALQPLLRPRQAGSARELEVDPRAAFPGRGQAAATAPAMVLFPRVGSELASRVTELVRAEALGRILHACAWVASEHLPNRDQQLGLLARLIDGARAYDVAVGTRILSDPTGAVAELKERLR